MLNLLASSAPGFGDEVLYFVKGFFGAPGIVIGIFALIGSILMRKRVTDIIISTCTAALGFFILAAGGAAIGVSLNHFSHIFTQLVGGANATMGNSDSLAAAILANYTDIATVASLMMFLAMILNILLARASRFKNIFLTAHHVMFMAVALTVVLQFVGMDISLGAYGFYAIIVGALLLSIYMTLTPSLTAPYMKELTGDDKMLIGHANVLGLALGGAIGRLVGKINKGKFKSAEDINMPKWMGFFKHSSIAVIFTMFFIFLIVYIALWASQGKEAFASAGITYTDSIPVLILTDALAFSAGVEVLIFGIIMMINQLIPAIEGVSRKAIHGARMGVDVSVGLKYQPTSVLIGFLSSFTAGLVVMGIAFGLNAADPEVFKIIVLPGIVVHFFTGGVAATFANTKGGVLGAVFAGFVNGLLISFIPIFFDAMYNGLGDSANGIIGVIGAPANNSEDVISNIQTMGWAETDYALILIIGLLLKAKWTVVMWVLAAAAILAYGSLAFDGICKEAKDRKADPTKYYERAIDNLKYDLEFTNTRYDEDIEDLNNRYKENINSEKAQKELNNIQKSHDDMIKKIEAKNVKLNQKYNESFQVIE